MEPSKNGRRSQLWKLASCVGLVAGAIVLAVTILILLGGGAICNSYGKRKVERAFADAYPGYILRIGHLEYSAVADRLVAESVSVNATNVTLKSGRISLAGVQWARLLWGKPALTNVFSRASLEATDLSVDFFQARYGLRCARLRGSVPDSVFSAEGTEFQPLIADKAFFAASEYRTTRYRVAAPEIKVEGLVYGELLQGKAYRARTIRVSRPSFDALVNCDKPAPPFVRSPLMLHEALAAIERPLQVAELTLTNGNLTYRERMTARADPGVLTFGDVSLFVADLANRGGPDAAFRIQAQGALMNDGVLKVQLAIPIRPAEFALHYSGSLSVMNLTGLNAFLDAAEYTRIKSGKVQEAAFEIEVSAGQAHGHVHAIYQDLQVAVLDKQTGTERGLGNRIASFLANTLKIRNANIPDAMGALKEGKVEYARQPGDEFLEFLWTALRGGVFDVIGH